MTEKDAIKKATDLLASGKVHNATATVDLDRGGWKVKVKGLDGLWRDAGTPTPTSEEERD